MATRAQIEANRRNATKSTGPRTEEGRIASSQNARRHGLRASVDEELTLEFLDMLREHFGWADIEDIPSSAIDLATAEARRRLVCGAAQEVTVEMRSPTNEQGQLMAVMRQMLADGRSMEVFDVALAHIGLTEGRVLRRDLAERYVSEAETNVSRKRRALVAEVVSSGQSSMDQQS
jgi:hypothetical protein